LGHDDGSEKSIAVVQADHSPREIMAIVMPAKA
jgi:hypothetical protein